LSPQGEEINVGIRGFTHGYDFYAPRDSVVFHEYAALSKRRKKIPMFW
jgi:Glycosyltransferase (GlcNAc)